MRAVVTGSSGFLGSEIANALHARGADVVGLDLAAPTSRFEDGRGPYETQRADLSCRGEWVHVLEGADLVVHAAARVGEAGTKRQFLAQNADATRLVLEAAADAGRLVHLSSIVVHGTSFPDPCPEDHPVQPTGNPYTDTKITAEHSVLEAAAAGRARASVVRLGDVYGPGSRQWTVRAVEMLKAGTFALVDGDRGVLSPVFVQDVVASVLEVADHPDALGETFHVTGGVGVSPREFFGFYARMLDVRLRSVPPLVARLAAPIIAGVSHGVGRTPPLSGRTLEYVTHPGTYSIEKVGRVIGWQPAVGLEDGMAQTEAWLRETGRI
ncbi:NAD-dependent epimerase/dehydratase family protein [Rubrivirga sp.]|uniref:NAD-dependent epimerase/dehydratase family protein n=1 Tax=Rubrivirga sp. TaxID=1885344 RepID=UPI003C71F103